MGEYVVFFCEIVYIFLFSFADMNAEEVGAGVFHAALFVIGEDTEIIV